MDMRELKALEIAARSKITCADGVWSVPSQNGHGTYRVVIWASPSCTCEDFQLRQQPCKHIHTARLVAERDGIKPAPNLCCLIQAACELEIEPVFWKDEAPQLEPVPYGADVIPFRRPG